MLNGNFADHYVRRSLELLLSIPKTLRSEDINMAITHIKHHLQDELDTPNSEISNEQLVENIPEEKKVVLTNSIASVASCNVEIGTTSTLKEDSIKELETNMEESLELPFKQSPKSAMDYNDFFDKASKRCAKIISQDIINQSESKDRFLLTRKGAYIKAPKVELKKTEKYQLDNSTSSNDIESIRAQVKSQASHYSCCPEDFKVDSQLIAKSSLARALSSRSISKSSKNKVELQRHDFPISKVLFTTHDIDNSGGITASEFRSLVYSMGYFLSDAEAAIAIELLDTDHDGEISYNEFLEWWKSDDRFLKLQLSQEQAWAVQSATQYFQFFDKDEKGYVNEEEFAQMYQDMMNYDMYFKPGTSLEEATIIIKRKTPNVTFNDYIAWLFRIGIIKHTAGT